jgi:hypothetical protein
MPLRKASVSIWFLLAMLVAIWGCGDGSNFAVAPVSGTVTLDGNPLADATVSFQPVAQTDDGLAGELSVGKTGADGKFTLKTTNDQDGAVVGQHVVRITTAQWKNSDESDNPDQIQASEEILPTKYNSQTELEFEVPVGGSQEANFTLTK